MMMRAPALMGLCLAAAIGVHLAGFTQFRTDDTPQIAAVGAPVEAKMGASFADLSTGIMQPVQTATPTDPMRSETTPSLAIRPDIAGAAPVMPTPSSATSATADAIVPRVSTIAQPPAAKAPIPQQPTTLAPTRPSQQLQAQTLAAPNRSLRPITRPARRQGNASQDAVAGASSSANRTATTTRSGSNATAERVAAQSNAAAANYAGVVLRQISNVRRRRTPESGVAVVAFTIGGNGGLTSVSILRSSGNRQVDRFAQQVIRRAAPFPPPPAGARTRWQVEIEDR